MLPRGTQMYPQDFKMEAPGFPNHPSKIMPGVLESWYWASSRTPACYALSLLHLQDVKNGAPRLRHHSSVPPFVIASPTSHQFPVDRGPAAEGVALKIRRTPLGLQAVMGPQQDS